MRSRLAALALVLSVGRPAHAQEGDALSRAEEAYLQVDFRSTLEHASSALETGGRSRRELIRIYELMGIAAAALEQEDDSRDAYIRMLALDPSRDVDRNLAPRLRSPFLEARGYWTARSDRLEAEVRLERSESGLVVHLTDPLDMAQAVVVRARLGGGGDWHESRQPAVEEQLVPITGVADADRVEYVIEVLDGRGNRLVELGAPMSPRVIGESELTGTAASTETGSPGGGNLLASPVFWGIAGAVLLGGAITAGVLLSDSDPGAQTTYSVGVR